MQSHFLEMCIIFTNIKICEYCPGFKTGILLEFYLSEAKILPSSSESFQSFQVYLIQQMYTWHRCVIICLLYTLMICLISRNLKNEVKLTQCNDSFFSDS